VHALVLALLLGNWPTAREAYPTVLRAQANALFGGDGLPRVGLREADSRAPDYDTYVERFTAKGADPEWRVSFNTLRVGFWPSAVLVALFLATPLSAGRRLLVTAGGLLWLDAVALLRVGVEIQRASVELAQGPGSSGDASLLLLRTLSEVVLSNVVTIAAVLLGWAAGARPRESLRLGLLGRVLRFPGAGRPPAT